MTIASVIDMAAMLAGLKVKQAEVHGMSQRGGDVQSHLRISSGVIYSDLIPRGGADLIISVEPLEALRYLDYLAAGGKVVTAAEYLKNIPDYPSEDKIVAELDKLDAIVVNSETAAREAGSPRSSNVVMLGAASEYTGVPIEKLKEALTVMFKPKGDDVVEMNLRAFDIGASLANGK